MTLRSMLESAQGRSLLFCCHLVWWLSCLPGWLAFEWACWWPEQTQRKLRQRLLKKNRAASWWRDKQGTSFSALPPSDYANLQPWMERIQRGERQVLTTEPVPLLQPTSGSTSGTKLIPFTRSLQQEFRRALDPWIWSLYCAWPRLLWGRQYWAISPVTPPPAQETAVPIGFADDAAYLSPLQRRVARRLIAVPPEISNVHNHDAWQYLTLLFLLRERNLRFISIWHPSFLTTLMRAFERQRAVLLQDVRAGTIRADLALAPDTRATLERLLRPAPQRAAELATSPLWPRLQVISCWTDGWSQHATAELARYFPGVAIQGKGLLATEGVTTLPLGRTAQRVCAVRSHVLEFADAAQRLHPVHELRPAERYSVILTTGGGLYRYRTHDLVEVTGFHRRTPCLRFLSRDDFTCDLVGEKLHLNHVERVLADAQSKLGLTLPFLMLAPAPTRNHYLLFAQAMEADATLASLTDELLCENYHYAHARRLGQLDPVELRLVGGEATECYRQRRIREGRRPGDLKVFALHRETDWEATLLAGVFTRRLP
ncbi:MAG: GH3 auxin-responsive promoter family protein [Kiritimatiellaeota bacterium]|nr:GH3 auxin-responsive promoter family protein [Kiritimatiellota bacterium]